MSHGPVPRETPRFIAQMRADAEARLMQMLARGEKIGDIHAGQPIKLDGSFSGPELEALMILMANAGVHVRPNRDAR